MNAHATRKLNFNKRILLGCAGALNQQLYYEETIENAGAEERKFLRNLESHNQKLAKMCTETAESITEFYSKHGSKRAQRDIAKRRAEKKGVFNGL